MIGRPLPLADNPFPGALIMTAASPYSSRFKLVLAFIIGGALVALLLKSGVFDKNLPPDTTGAWGKFSGNPKTEMLKDGRKLKLLEEFTYTDPHRKTWVAPKSWEVDGASIPQVFWSIIGGPLEGPYRNASICHDVECDRKTHSWKDVHRMFYEGCRCGGLSENMAKTMYAAVYHFGPRWEMEMIAKNAPRVDHKGKKVFEAVFVPVIVPTKSTDQPAKDVRDKFEQYMKDRNPSLEDIEKLEPRDFGVPKPE
jgi:Protein of unknown function (DUF1353)